MTSTPPASPDTLQWSDAYLLGFDPMDQVHEEFVGLVARMQVAEAAELPALLDAFAVHAQAHFQA